MWKATYWLNLSCISPIYCLRFSCLGPPLWPGGRGYGASWEGCHSGVLMGARAAHCSQSIHNNGYRGIYKVRRNQDICGRGKLLSTIGLLLNILIIISWMDVSWWRWKPEKMMRSYHSASWLIVAGWAALFTPWPVWARVWGLLWDNYLDVVNILRFPHPRPSLFSCQRDNKYLIIYLITSRWEELPALKPECGKIINAFSNNIPMNFHWHCEDLWVTDVSEGCSRKKQRSTILTVQHVDVDVVYTLNSHGEETV